MFKKTAIIAGCALALSTPVNAKYLYGFANMYYDYQKWDHELGSNNSGKSDWNDDHDSFERTEKRNQAVIGIDGGAGFDWGEIYGFYDNEDIAHGARSDWGQSHKVNVHYHFSNLVNDVFGGNMEHTDWGLYWQAYDVDDHGFDETNRVWGIGYTGLAGNGWWWKPWIGVHHVNSNLAFNGGDTEGFNGGMAGWTGGYLFNIGEQKFTLVNWHEMEFERMSEYAESQGGHFGVNGGLVLLWNVTDHWSTGFTVRYTYNKLGINNFNNFMIYRIQYSF